MSTWRILIVDDDEVDRRAVKRALARGKVDADVVEATDCPSAIEQVTQSHWDCVILDYQLPGGDGMEVMAAARAQGKGTPFIVLTGQGDEQLAVDLMKRGAADYLPKPLMTPERLSQSVRQSIRVAQAEQREQAAAVALAAQVAKLGYLVEAGARIHAAPSVTETLATVAIEAKRLMGASMAFALLRDDAGPLTGLAMDGLPAEASDRSSALPDLIEHVPTAAESLCIGAVEMGNDPSLSRVAAALERRGVRVVGWLSAPMTERGGDRVGGIHLARSSGPFEASDAHLLAELAHTSSIALQNARLYRAEQDATRARDNVLAIVSHDLRSPLNNVALSSSLLDERLSEREDGAPKERQLVKRIVTGVGRINRLIEDLLEVSRIEAGTLSVAMRAENAGALVSESLDNASPVAEAKGCRILRGTVDEALRVICDRDRVLQLFSNLLGNAIRFTPAGGTITVSAEADAEWVMFTVTDEGPGVDPAHLPRLFERFWRGPDAARGGAGLGLFIARGIVEAHGGRIQLDSTPGRGAQVKFWLKG